MHLTTERGPPGGAGGGLGRMCDSVSREIVVDASRLFYVSTEKFPPEISARNSIENLAAGVWFVPYTSP